MLLQYLQKRFGYRDVGYDCDHKVALVLKVFVDGAYCYTGLPGDFMGRRFGETFAGEYVECGVHYLALPLFYYKVLLRLFHTCIKMNERSFIILMHEGLVNSRPIIPLHTILLSVTIM